MLPIIWKRIFIFLCLPVNIYIYIYCCFFYFWGFGGFEYSPIANFDFRTYSNTCWIMFGTSKMFTRSGPLHPLFIMTRKLQTIPANPQKACNNNIFLYIYIYISTFLKSNNQSLYTNGHHKMYIDLLDFSFFEFWWSRIAPHKVFITNRILLWWNLDIFWKSGNS